MKLNFREVNEEVAEFAVLRFFPAEPAARAAIVRLVGEMAADMSQVRWLVKRMTSGIYNEWPGPGELRGCFCSKFKPADGINACSEVYPDGIPSERGNNPLQLPSGARAALPPGHQSSANPKLEAMVQTTAANAALPPARLFGRHEKEFAARLEEAITGPVDRPSELPEAEKPLPETPPVGPDGQFVQAASSVTQVPTRQLITQADVDAVLAGRRKAVSV